MASCSPRLALLVAALLLVTCSAQSPNSADRTTQRAARGRGVRWLDEGEAASAEIREWQQERTFCFMENATLRVRLDPLNSTMQPQAIRAFSHLPEAKAVFNATNDALAYLENFAWPLRSFFWAWSQLRVVVVTPDRDQFQFAFARTPGALCRSVKLAAEAAPGLAEWVPDTGVQVVETFLHLLTSIVCEQCVHGCGIECVPLADSPTEACMLELSPYHAPCITVTGPPQPYLSMTEPELSFSIAFFTYLSSVYAQNFFLGLVLFYLSERLSRSRLFHYLLGATMGICFSALLALYFLQRQTHSATKMIPGAQLLQSLGSMLSVVVPFTGFVVVPSLYWVVARGVQYLIFIWNRETLFGVPHLGKIYFVAFGLLGCGIMWWNQWGAPAKSDEPAQKQEEIDEIGYLEEDSAPTTFQVVLSRSLKLLGFTLLFYSTSSTEMSLLLVLLVSLSRVFEFIAFVLYFWYHFEKPGRHTVLISKKEFEAQGASETEKALKQLQEFLQKNPDELDKVREDNEVRLRRFVKGRNHLDVATRESAAKAKAAASSHWACAIQ